MKRRAMVKRSVKAHEFVRALLVASPNNRPSAEEVKQLPWIAYTAREAAAAEGGCVSPEQAEAGLESSVVDPSVICESLANYTNASKLRKIALMVPSRAACLENWLVENFYVAFCGSWLRLVSDQDGLSRARTTRARYSWLSPEHDRSSKSWHSGNETEKYRVSRRNILSLDAGGRAPLRQRGHRQRPIGPRLILIPLVFDRSGGRLVSGSRTY